MKTGSTPFKWNAAGGYQHVPFTGLYHVGAREYDPRTARWLQRDPIGQSSGDPNLYRYCGNDAVNLNDPSGLDTHIFEFRDRYIVRTTLQFRGDRASIDNVHRVVRAMLKAWNKGFTYNDKVVEFHIDFLIGGSVKDGYDQVFLQSGGAGERSYVEVIPCNPNLPQVPSFHEKLRPTQPHKMVLYSANPNYDWTAAHEFGHLLGLHDKYDRATNLPLRGWEQNIMARHNKPVDMRNIEEFFLASKRNGGISVVDR